MFILLFYYKLFYGNGFKILFCAAYLISCDRMQLYYILVRSYHI